MVADPHGFLSDHSPVRLCRKDSIVNIISRTGLCLLVLSLLSPVMAQNSRPNSPPPEEEGFFDEEENLGGGAREDGEGAEVDETVKPSQVRSRFNRDRFRSKKKKEADDDVFTPPVVNNLPTTPVEDIEIEGVAKRRKGRLKFADAFPEDINNENFPELIKSFDYPNADIMDVTDAIAKLTGKNFIFEPGVRGKITIKAPTQVTVAEAWEAFLTALAMNGFTVVHAGKFLQIRKMASAKDSAIETFSGAYYPENDQLITRIIKLKYIDAEAIKKSLTGLISKKAGEIFAYEKTNSLIVSGLGSGIKRISRIVEELDKPGFEERLEVFPIANAKAKDISDLAKKIINKGDTGKKTSFRRSRFSRNKKGSNESLSLVEPDERTNSIIVVGNSQGVNRMKKLIQRLDYPLDPADAGGVYVYYVKHGEAKLISETLSGIAEDSEKAAKKNSGGSSGSKTSKDFSPPKKSKPLFNDSVAIKADENTNSLVINASRQDYKTIANLLSKLDIPKDQVFVEAIILEMEASDDFRWQISAANLVDTGAAAGATNNVPPGIGFNGHGGGAGLIGAYSPLTTPGAVLNFADKDNLMSVTVGGQTFQIPNLLGLVNILKSKVNANVLSTPHILAMDNEESEIEVGDQVPVGNAQTTGVGGVVQTAPQFEDATILLKIKPFISPESDVVRLNVEQRINGVSSSPLAQLDGAQGLSKKLLKTNIVLRDGQTAVLGGLMEDREEINETKVPLLGDIPVLGWLFKSRSKDIVKQNLLVFLTPKIIRNSSDHDGILKSKLSERINWLKKYGKGRDPHGATLARKIGSVPEDEPEPDSSFDENLDIEDATPIDDSVEEEFDEY